MDPIAPSGLFISNKLARIIYLSLADVLGEDGLHVILNHAALAVRASQLPPENGERQIDFAEVSGLFRSLEDLYGERGDSRDQRSRARGLRAQRGIFFEHRQRDARQRRKAVRRGNADPTANPPPTGCAGQRQYLRCGTRRCWRWAHHPALALRSHRETRTLKAAHGACTGPVLPRYLL